MYEKRGAAANVIAMLRLLLFYFSTSLFFT
jgi:hypothetical protein